MASKMDTIDIVRGTISEVNADLERIRQLQESITRKTHTIEMLLRQMENKPGVDNYLHQFFEMFCEKNPGLRNIVSAAAKSYWSELLPAKQDELVHRYGSKDKAVSALAKQIHNQRRNPTNDDST